MGYEIEKSLDDWRKELDAHTFKITRMGDTERAFYW
jgi:peptide methionine sulfoxide reductase MsrB